MSIENAHRFLGWLERDCTNPPAPAATLDDLVRHAAAAGFVMTDQELATAIEDRVGSSGELDDAVLDTISAGGAFEDFDRKALAYHDLLMRVVTALNEMRARSI